jgi:hypothetical protein
MGATNDTYDVFLTINTSGNTSAATQITTVAPKVSSSIVSATLLSAPGGVGAWTQSLGGTNSGGCDNAGSGFFCAQAIGSPFLMSSGSGSFEWEITVTHGTPILDVASIKAIGSKADGSFVFQTSEDVPLTSSVPEPSSLGFMLIGSGLIAVARRRFKNSRTN